MINKKQHFKNQNFEMSIVDGIFHIVVLQESFSLHMAKECVIKRIELTEGKSYAMLSDCRKVISFEKQARAYLAEFSNTRYLTAGALLVENQLQIVLGNFFLLINKPHTPAKLFEDKQKALKWLKQFKVQD